MKWRPLRRLLLCLSLLVALLSVLWSGTTTPVRADDNLTISPSSGPPGTVLTITPNAGAQTFPAGTVLQPYYVSGCSGNAGSGPVSPVNGDGSIPTMTLTIPLTETAPCPAVSIIVEVYPSSQPNVAPVYAYGPYSFSITGVGSVLPPTPTATLQPGVSPSPGTTATQGPVLSLSPAIATPGQAITVSGTGFAPSTQITISGLSASPATALTDTNGTFSTQLPLGAGIGTPGAALQVVATDIYGHSATASLSIDNGQPPTLSITANVVTAGQQVQVTGSNYAAGDLVSVALALPGAPNSPLPGTVQTAQIPLARTLALVYTVPIVTPGSYLLIAVGQPSNRAATPVPLTVQAAPGAASPTPSTSTGLQPFATEPPVATSPTPPPLVGFPTATPVLLPTATATATATAPTPKPTATPTPSSAPAETTYFAEGYTGQVVHGQGVSFKEQLYLFNTTGTATTVTITYFVVVNSSGATRAITRQVRLPAMAAAVRLVNADAGNNQLVSIEVHHPPGVTARVVISRTDAKGHALDSAATTGSPRAALTWYFAEGYAGVTFQEYLSLFNPSSTPATVHVHFATPTGLSRVTLSYTVPRFGRLSLNIGALYLRQAGASAPKSIGLMVSSNQNIVVDRTLYWGAGAGSGKYGYAIVPGVVAGAASLLFPVLSPTRTTESYLTLLNPNPMRVGLQIVFRGAGGHVVTSYTNTMAPLSRLTVDVRAAMPAGTGLVSATLNATAPLVAEAPLYTNGSPNSGEHAGIDLAGTTASVSAALAGIDATHAALYVYNPNAAPLAVKGTFGSAAGLAAQGLITIPALHVEVVALPGAGGPRGLLLTAPAPFAAALLNGTSSPISWGNALAPTQ